MAKAKKQMVSAKTQMIAGLAILTAIVIVLQVASTAITRLFPALPFSITLTLIPIVIGAALYGPKAGAYLGAVFSLVVIISGITGFDVGSATVFNIMPAMFIIVCLIRGIAAGFVAGLVYKLLAKKNSILATFVAAICAPVVNTGLFLVAAFLFMRPMLEAGAAQTGYTNIFLYVIIVVVGVNFLIELGSNIILSPIVVRILKAIKANN